MLQISFQYMPKGANKLSTSSLRAAVRNPPTNTHWSVDLQFNLGIRLSVPVPAAYLILDLAEDYSYTTVGVPDRSYIWIMISDKPVYTDGECECECDDVDDDDDCAVVIMIAMMITMKMTLAMLMLML